MAPESPHSKGNAETPEDKDTRIAWLEKQVEYANSLADLISEQNDALVQQREDSEYENYLSELHKKHLKELAAVDALTGLRNRGAFIEEFERALAVVRGEARVRKNESFDKVSLVFLDIDLFKAVNDTYGHGAGDEVLRSVSKLLRESVRRTDVVALVEEQDEQDKREIAGRLGGEEFIVLLRGVDENFAAERAEELRKEISQMTFAEYPKLKVTASFGVVSSDFSKDGEVLMKAADEALYEAKNGGRDRVVVRR